MRILVVGGTWFLGRAVVQAAVEHGHDVAIFNRGRSRVDLPEGVTVLRGDRRNPVDRRLLANAGPWDAVIDVPGVVPAEVRDLAGAVAAVCSRYVFVSTVSVYRDWPETSVDEDSPIHDGDPDADAGSWVWGTGVYGPFKAGAEAAVRREIGEDRALIVRPGVILGPHEYSGRLTWWLARCFRGGQILAPGAPGREIRVIDVRDIASFVIDLVVRGETGTMNVAGPSGRDSFRDLLRASVEATRSAGELVWVDPDWLAGQGVRQWTELPLWRIAPGTWSIDTSRAESKGLTCRRLVDTVNDTWAWLSGGGTPVSSARRASHGIDPSREADVIASWLARPLPPGG